METLRFGKFKGQAFDKTPEWYQKWLLSQDWYKASKEVLDFIASKNESYALIENGIIHTDDLSLEDANEMLERHKNCFPDCRWEILPMNSVNGMDKAEGILQRHARISSRYYS